VGNACTHVAGTYDSLILFGLGVTIAYVITLALEMPSAFALATLVFQMWVVFAPGEVSTFVNLKVIYNYL
jgi:hypothetical protein